MSTEGMVCDLSDGTPPPGKRKRIEDDQFPKANPKNTKSWESSCPQSSNGQASVAIQKVNENCEQKSVTYPASHCVESLQGQVLSGVLETFNQSDQTQLSAPSRRTTCDKIASLTFLPRVSLSPIHSSKAINSQNPPWPKLNRRLCEDAVNDPTQDASGKEESNNLDVKISASSQSPTQQKFQHKLDDVPDDSVKISFSRIFSILAGLVKSVLSQLQSRLTLFHAVSATSINENSTKQQVTGWINADLYFVIIVLVFTSYVIFGSIFGFPMARVITEHSPSHSTAFPDYMNIAPRKYIGTGTSITSAARTSSTINEDMLLISTSDRPVLTLRDVLNDEKKGFHLAMAPAFFGFYGYFGALDAWEIALDNEPLHKKRLQSVAGASAGAMAAVLLAAGIRPKEAADFVSTIQLSEFADFPGVFAVFRGNKFEKLMNDFLMTRTTDNVNGPISRLEDAIVPIAISGFDIQKMKAYILTQGSMARAARASATFPFLFQPVGWIDDTTKTDHLLIDGGIADPDGVLGLNTTINRLIDHKNSKEMPRVINLSIGSFYSFPPPGPSMLPGNPDVISISIENLPQPGPWAMSKGPKAIEAARNAMLSSLDIPLRPARSNEYNHYELRIDATPFCCNHDSKKRR